MIHRTTNARKNLSILMMPSQTNAVPPMSSSQPLQEDISKANIHIGRVSEILAKIPDDFLKSSKARRRLDAFVKTNRP